jgi:hypothetical protein
MSHNNESLIDKNNNSNIEPFDKIEQGQKRYIPNIPSVISDMKKNNININSSENNTNNKETIITEKEENKNYELKEQNLNVNNNINDSQGNGVGNTLLNYWNTFKNNQTISTIINPFQDESECVNKVYKIYSCITISLILIVILLSITLINSF